MKSKEIRNLALEELSQKLSELRKELIKLRSQSANKTSLKNPYQIKKIRKVTARILTELNARKKKISEKVAKKSEKSGKIAATTGAADIKKGQKKESKK